MFLSLLAAAVMADDQVYLATYFLGNGESGAMLAVSEDGYKFEPIVSPQKAIMVTKDGLMRDPCILYGPDKQWHMVWTTAWWGSKLALSHSKDLVHWAEPTYVDAMGAFPDTSNTWAPEITYDGGEKRYTIFWSSTVQGKFLETARQDGDLDDKKRPLNNRFYYTTTKDFKTFAPTQLLWDPGFNCIDATLLRYKNTWYLFGKDETKAPKAAKWLFVAGAEKMRGPFKMVANPITGKYWCEGPTAVDTGHGVRVYFDRYTDGHWGAVESTDMKTWTDLGNKIEFVPGGRHGTILRVKRSLVDGIRKALGANR